jgi:predicted DNA-binding transcriptional regulator YafY
MLSILEARGIVKVKELSERLEVSERQIRRYKRDLEDVGVHLSSLSGKNGGLKLENKVIDMDINVIGDENIPFLSVIQDFLQSDKKENEDISSVFKNILANRKISSENISKLEKINNVIEEKRKIILTYLSPSSGKVQRTIHPYYIYQSYDSYYLIGYDETRDDIRIFKIKRIKSIKALDEKFKVDEKLLARTKKALKNSLGVFPGKDYNVKLKIHKDTIQYFEEDFAKFVYVKELEKDGYYKVEFSISGINEIAKYIMKEGSKIIVLKPKELKDMIIRETKKVLDNYDY